MEWYDWILTENCCAAKNTDSADELIPSVATVPLIVRTPAHAVRKDVTMMSSIPVLISEANIYDRQRHIPYLSPSFPETARRYRTLASKAYRHRP